MDSAAGPRGDQAIRRALSSRRSDDIVGGMGDMTHYMHYMHMHSTVCTHCHCVLTLTSYSLLDISFNLFACHNSQYSTSLLGY